MKNLSPPQKIKNPIYEHNCANWFFFVHCFCIFAFLGFCCVRFSWGSFLRGMKKQTKTNSKQNNKNKKGRRTTRCKQEDHLVFWQRKKQHRNKIIQINSLKWIQATQENKQEQKHKTWNPNYPFNQHNSKNTRIQEKKQLFFFHRLKAKQETRQKQKHRAKTKNTKNIANIETERLKHTPWKQKQEQHNKK